MGTRHTGMVTVTTLILMDELRVGKRHIIVGVIFLVEEYFYLGWVSTSNIFFIVEI